MRSRYVVLYYSGGTERGKWRRVFDEYSDEAQARRIAHGIERMGYKTHVFDKDQLTLGADLEEPHALDLPL